MVWVIGIGIGLLLLFAFPRQMGYLFLFLVIGVGAIALYFWAQNDQAQRDRQRLIATASIDAAQCADPAFPLSIVFTNRNTKTVEYIGFNVEGRRQGYSQPAYSNYQSWDRIMQPDSTYGACWSLSEYKTRDLDTRALLWAVTVNSVRFR